MASPCSLARSLAETLTRPENIVEQFSLNVQIAEARAFYAFQSMMEQVHSETYSLLIETYVRDSQEKDYLFNGMENSASGPNRAHSQASGGGLTGSPRHTKESRLGPEVHHS